MATAITIPKGDTAKPITGTLTFGTPPTPQNLTGAALQFRLKDPSTGAVAIAVTAEILGDPLLGRYSVPGAARAAWESGEYLAEMVVTYGDASVDIFPSERISQVLIRERWT